MFDRIYWEISKIGLFLTYSFHLCFKLLLEMSEINTFNFWLSSRAETISQLIANYLDYQIKVYIICNNVSLFSVLILTTVNIFLS